MRVFILFSVLLLSSCKFDLAEEKPVENSIGRYQVTKLNEYSFIVLDTKSGRVWRNIRYTDLKGDPEYLEELQYIDGFTLKPDERNIISISDVINRNGLKEKGK